MRNLRGYILCYPHSRSSQNLMVGTTYKLLNGMLLRVAQRRAGRRKPPRPDLVSVSTEYAKCMTFFVMGMLVCRSRAELFAQLRSAIFNQACRSLQLLLEPLDQGALTGVGVKRLL